MRLLMIDDERTSFEILRATVDWKAFDIVPPVLRYSGPQWTGRPLI